MSVLSCSRYNCDNIMCDIYIPSVGYICNECKNEFIDKYSHCNISSSESILSLLENFMDTKYCQSFDNKTELLKFFEQYE